MIGEGRGLSRGFSFELAVMVGASPGIGLYPHRACPEFLRTDAGKIDGSFAVHARGMGRVRIEYMTGDHVDAVKGSVRNPSLSARICQLLPSSASCSSSVS
jgi:hypothetical protein